MRILYICTVGQTMTFFEHMIRELFDEGHTVDIACGNVEEVPEYYREWGCRIFSLSCCRSPFRAGNIKAVRQIRQIIRENRYDIVHCHTPVASACARLACEKNRKRGLRVIYTAHGFHFHKGAPLKNWLIYFPAEWLLSFFTDDIITINTEDYQRAKRWLHFKRLHYVPGMGIDVKSYENVRNSRERIRKSLGIRPEEWMLFSCGELNRNKNHRVIIEAIAEVLKEKQELTGCISYVIAGRGDQEERLKKLADEKGVELKLLGFRTDIPEILGVADLFLFPSKREGLGLAAIEAMAAGVPIITSNIHGIKDYSINGMTGYSCPPDDVNGFAEAIKKLLFDADRRKRMSEEVKKSVERFDYANVNYRMKEIYMETG